MSKELKSTSEETNIPPQPEILYHEIAAEEAWRIMAKLKVITFRFLSEKVLQQRDVCTTVPGSLSHLSWDYC